MWQDAYRTPLFFEGGGSRDNCDGMFPLKKLSHGMGPALNQLTQTSAPVKNQSNHWALKNLIRHDYSVGPFDKARQAGITPVSPNQSLQPIYHAVICGKGILPGAQTARMHGYVEPIAEPAVILLGWLMRSSAQCLMCLIWAADEAVTLTEPTRLCDWWRHLQLSSLAFIDTVL